MKYTFETLNNDGIGLKQSLCGCQKQTQKQDEWIEVINNILLKAPLTKKDRRVPEKDSCYA